jgi:MYXO-CTERM domain-containing protein
MRHAVVVGALLAAGLLATPSAEACGGFFCSRVPIDQAGERIVFGVRDNTVEAHIQIQYQGAAEKFSWVVPMTAQPTLSVGSPLIFSFLDARTQPRFMLEWQNRCMDSGRGGEDLASDGNAPPQAPSPNEGNGVTVISQEQVGPYDAAILQAEESQALRTWLVDNGYDLTPQGAEALEPYVGRGNYFVALKLQQNKQVGDLRPIVVRFQGNRPCIPIKLTAIAARPNMPIISYVLSNKRAIPMNYRHVLINLSRVDWLNGGSNYSQVATAAVDEAGGRAFLTEFAGAAAPFAAGFESFLPDYDTARLAAIPHPVDFSAELLRQGFARDPSIQGLLRKYIPIPASLVAKGVTEQQFYNLIFNYRSDIDSDPGRAPFNATGFAQELEESVVKPAEVSLALLKAHPYLTRLYTTMSAEEMTVDPDFDFNSDAPDVPNLYTAKAFVETCEEDWSKRKIRIELPDGRYYNTRIGQGPITQGPNSVRIEQWTDVGPAALIQDNRALVDKALEDVDGGVLNSGCACSSAEAGSAALLSLLLAAWGARRRRKA